MGMVLKFPAKPGTAERLREIAIPVVPVAPKATPSPGVAKMGFLRVLVSHSLNAVWILTLLLWPVLRWIIAIDVAFQAARMAITWNDPGANAGLTFLVHFVFFAALTYFVINYKSKKD